MIKYDYYSEDKGIRQYADINPQPYQVVNARYVKSPVEAYQGNPLIEALPYYRTQEEIINKMTCSLPSWDYNNIAAMSDEERMAMIPLLKCWRFPLPYQISLDKNFYLNQLTTYSQRKLSRILTLEGSPEYSCNAPGNAPNESIALLGTSGCGKSTAIHNLLDGYPQIIRHSFDDGTSFTQITYILVECPVNSNLRLLLEMIGREIDKCAGYDSPKYELFIRRKSTIGGKAAAIADLICKFSIGTIFVDEIQHMNFNANKDSSFESILSIINMSGVSVCTIGTEEAYELLYKGAASVRRAGIPTIADAYCVVPNYFSTVVTSLFEYQLFDEPVELTEELIAAFYNATWGVISKLVTLYSYITSTYLSRPRDKRVPITPESIQKAATKIFPGRVSLGKKFQGDHFAVNSQGSVTNEQLYEAACFIKSLTATGETKRNAKRFNEALSQLKTSYRVTKQNVSVDELIAALRHVSSLKDHLNDSASELAEATHQYIQDMVASERLSSHTSCSPIRQIPDITNK